MLLASFSRVCTRRFHRTTTVFKKSPTDLKGRSKSSQEWLSRQLNDPYVKRAQMGNYRARSAFKLIEIDDKYAILRPGSVVIDCGAAPGAWTQVTVERINAEGKDASHSKGQVISVDLKYFQPINGAVIIDQSDFTLESTQKLIFEQMQKNQADVIISDMAPNASGMHAMDHENIMVLCQAAFGFAKQVLRNNGIFLCKLWEGGQSGKFKKDLAKTFKTVKIVKPDSSRKDSAEMFFLARGFHRTV
ncbi:rRNA methyltransferase 2, mitochondrial-like [Saccoglossus kowalevskii]|uniref:rRNA methyltransferase 2, mitochondrial n=1 Tax=Saccoglossus kowalevskii TaxID=10224 RepID=A0ABM0MDZ7_SACKO|nr:PREDICTED: putative ribosomal RNA methyltransferase CG11447-like [Saccoglossus kowalevskii]